MSFQISGICSLTKHEIRETAPPSNDNTRNLPFVNAITHLWGQVSSTFRPFDPVTSPCPYLASRIPYLDFWSFRPFNSVTPFVSHISNRISHITILLDFSTLRPLDLVCRILDTPLLCYILTNMKKCTFAICILLVAQLSFAQNDNGSIIDRLKQLDSSNLHPYFDPLMTGFGVALGTGIFYTASTHRTLGFDIGFRYIHVNIPSSARYFTGTALACSLANDGLVWYDIEVDSVSTIFGPGESTTVPITGNAHANPSVYPGGLDVTFVPFVMPQINVGFPFGLELGFGYLPLAFTFPLDKESNIYFIRLGGKLGFNKLPFLKEVTFPCALAFGGFYQRMGMKGGEGEGAITMTLWNLQILASKRLATPLFFDIEPFLAGGVEGTKYNFRYDFQKVIPDTISGIPTDSIIVTEPVDFDIYQQNRLRTIIGLTLYAGPIYLHYDYNIVKFKTHNFMLGVTIR